MSHESSRPPRVPRRVGSSSRSSSASKGGKSAKSSKGTDDSVVMKWAIRGIVAALLIGLIVIAALDFARKGQSSQTADAWIAELNKAETAGTPLKFSTLEPLKVGSPTRTESSQSVGANVNTTKTYTYTWSGTFRKYTVNVIVEEEPGSEPIVRKVEVGGK